MHYPSSSWCPHLDLDAMVFQEPRQLLAGELAILIGVEDLGAAIL
jgi:hypothetical protein